jgi:cardiolipin synthase
VIRRTDDAVPACSPSDDRGGEAVVPQENIVNIPNALSLYRLVMVPVIAAVALSGAETAFTILIAISLATDGLDGFIARTFSLETAFGARHDSIADDANYVAVFFGIFAFKQDEIGVHMPFLYVFLAVLISTNLVHLWRFGRAPSFHLYSFRLSGVLQIVLLLTLFTVGFEPWLYYTVLSVAIGACAEIIAVTLVADRPLSNARGLWWVLRERRREAILAD